MAKKIKKAKTTYDKVSEIDPNFAAEVYSLRVDEINGKLATLAKARSETEEAKSADPDLKSLREQLKTASETYNEPLKAYKLKTKFLIEVLNERGTVSREGTGT